MTDKDGCCGVRKAAYSAADTMHGGVSAEGQRRVQQRRAHWAPADRTVGFNAFPSPSPPHRATCVGVRMPRGNTSTRDCVTRAQQHQHSVHCKGDDSGTIITARPSTAQHTHAQHTAAASQPAQHRLPTPAAAQGCTPALAFMFGTKPGRMRNDVGVSRSMYLSSSS